MIICIMIRMLVSNLFWIIMIKSVRIFLDEFMFFDEVINNNVINNAPFDNFDHNFDNSFGEKL